MGSSAFARHYLRNHFCFLLLGVLRCFSSPRSPHPIGDGTSTAAGGFPHSEIPGSSRICRSPGLIAAYHVLLRLHEPRYPPFALLSFLLYSWYLNDTEIRFSFSSSFQHVKDHWPFPGRVENKGLEPLTPCVQGRCSKPTELIPRSGYNPSLFPPSPRLRLRVT